MPAVQTSRSAPKLALKPILHKAGALLCLCSILMASGVHTAALQTYAWAKMYTVYSEYVPSCDALELTFSGENLCGVCALSQATLKELANSLELSLNEQTPLLAHTYHFVWKAPSADHSPSHGFSPPRSYQEITLAFEPPPPRAA